MLLQDKCNNIHLSCLYGVSSVSRTYLTQSYVYVSHLPTIVPCDYTLITFANFTASLIEREFIELSMKRN